MRNPLYQLAAIAAIACAFSGGAMAQAVNGGNINFTGEIVDAPCDISPISQNMTVPLGKVSRTLLDGSKGKYATPSKFTIDLVNCGATAKGATVSFTGTGDTIDTTYLKIANAGQTGKSAASGVAIELRDNTSKKIPLGTQSAQYLLGTGENKLKFEAVYVSTGDAVTVGPADSTAQFTVTYN